MSFKDRIVSFSVEPAEQFLAHPHNFRRHPQVQRDALAGSLSTVGWVAPVVVNDRTGYLLDGHARLEEALRTGSKVPVVHVDLSREEEFLVLATHDKIGALAIEDHDAYKALVEQIQAPVDAALQGLLSGSTGGGGAQTESPLRFVVIRAEDEAEMAALLELLDPQRLAPTAEKSDLRRLTKFDNVRLLSAGPIVDRMSSGQ